jgi:uncharacterized RDD family membrane protein YckC
MTEDTRTPWERWTAKNLATPKQKIRWSLILWVFCLIIAPLMVMDGHDRIGTRIFLIGAVVGWVPALVIFLKHRKAEQDQNERSQN